MDVPQKSSVYPVVATLIVFMLALTIYAWYDVSEPVRIPVHWGIDGSPDRYGGKAEGLLLIPLLSLLFLLLFWLLPKLDPRRGNLEKSRKAFTASIVAIVTFLALAHTIIVTAALGIPVDVASIIPAAIGILFMVLGNYMGKIRSNFFFGFRTPWTLASERAWNKTHRLAGWTMVIAGLFITGAAILGNGRVTMTVLIASVTALVLAPTLYSYVVWKNDPLKQRHEQ